MREKLLFEKLIKWALRNCKHKKNDHQKIHSASWKETNIQLLENGSMALGSYKISKYKEQFQANWSFNESALGMGWNIKKDVYQVH